MSTNQVEEETSLVRISQGDDNGEEGPKRRPHGYVAVQKRLNRAIRHGLVPSRWGRNLANLAFRVRDNKPIWRKNLKTLSAELDAWEKAQSGGLDSTPARSMPGLEAIAQPAPVRRRRRAPAQVARTRHVGRPSQAEEALAILTVIEAFQTLSPASRARLLKVIAAG